MRQLLKFFAISVLFSVLLSCAHNSVSGDVTETGNAAIAGVVKNSNGVSLSGVLVSLLSVTGITAEPYDTTQSDSNGEFEFSVDTGKIYRVYTKVHDTLCFISKPIVVSLDSAYLSDVVVNRSSEYRVVVMADNNPLKGVIAVLNGTQFTTESSSKGIVSFVNIPQGSYTLHLSSSNLNFEYEKSIVVYSLETSQEIDTIVIHTSDTSVVDTSSSQNAKYCIILEDFSDKDNVSSITSVLGELQWWDIQSDLYVNGNSQLLHPKTAAPDDFKSAIVNDTFGHEDAFEIRYIPGTLPGGEKDFPYVYAKLNIGNRFYDFSSMDSLAFSGRGDGYVVVELLQYSKVYGIKVGAWEKFKLTPEWKNFRLLPDSLNVDVMMFQLKQGVEVQDDSLYHNFPYYTSEPATWNDMGGIINSVKFYFTEGSKALIDDILVYGVDIAELRKN